MEASAKPRTVNDTANAAAYMPDAAAVATSAMLAIEVSKNPPLRTTHPREHVTIRRPKIERVTVIEQPRSTT